MKFIFLLYSLQIENEYQIDEFYYGESGKSYVKWEASMAVGQNTGVPWVMCKQEDAPDPVVSFVSLLQIHFHF